MSGFWSKVKGPTHALHTLPLLVPLLAFIAGVRVIFEDRVRIGDVIAGNRVSIGDVIAGNRVSVCDVIAGNRVSVGDVIAGNRVSVGDVIVGNWVSISDPDLGSVLLLRLGVTSPGALGLAPSGSGPSSGATLTVFFP